MTIRRIITKAVTSAASYLNRGELWYDTATNSLRASNGTTGGILLDSRSTLVSTSTQTGYYPNQVYQGTVPNPGCRIGNFGVAYTNVQGVHLINYNANYCSYIYNISIFSLNNNNGVEYIPANFSGNGTVGIYGNGQYTNIDPAYTQNDTAHWNLRYYGDYLQLVVTDTTNQMMYRWICQYTEDSYGYINFYQVLERLI